MRLEVRQVRPVGAGPHRLPVRPDAESDGFPQGLLRGVDRELNSERVWVVLVKSSCLNHLIAGVAGIDEAGNAKLFQITETLCSLGFLLGLGQGG